MGAIEDSDEDSKIDDTDEEMDEDYEATDDDEDNKTHDGHVEEKEVDGSSDDEGEALSQLAAIVTPPGSAKKSTLQRSKTVRKGGTRKMDRDAAADAAAVEGQGDQAWDDQGPRVKRINPSRHFRANPHSRLQQ